MKIHILILDIAIEKPVERTKCRSEIVITTIISILRNCCYEIFEYFEKDDIKIKDKLEDDIIHMQILMEYNMYLEKIGKYVEDQQRKILNDLSIKIRLKVKKIYWENILGKEN